MSRFVSSNRLEASFCEFEPAECDECPDPLEEVSGYTLPGRRSGDVQKVDCLAPELFENFEFHRRVLVLRIR